jgi:uracil phosphoribosyltransferase
MLTIISKQNCVVSQYLVELRDRNIQMDSFKFRQNMRRIGSILAYEISKTLSFAPKDVETPLGISNENEITDQLCLTVLLRAGLPLHEGLLDVFPNSDNGFISANRHLHKHGALTIDLNYMTMPEIDGKVVILCDAMIATGASVAKSIEAILEKGTPKKIHIVAAIGSSDGVQYLQRVFPKTSIWLAAMDEELTGKSYIVPGLGDAGDLSYGVK